MHVRVACARFTGTCEHAWSLLHICTIKLKLLLVLPSQVLLLDEITVDLDVVGRIRLLGFFREECEKRNATIVYATHIFDGLENWITHLAYMEDGRFIKGEQNSAGSS